MDPERNELTPAIPNQVAPQPPPDRRRLGLIVWRVLTSVEVKALAPPRVPPDLPQMSAPLRLYACLRLFLLDVEWAVSPAGHLRGLAKVACRVALAAGIVCLCLASLLAGVALIIGEVVVITGQVVMILWNLLHAALLVSALVILGAGLLFAVRHAAGPPTSGSSNINVHHRRRP